MNKQKHTLLKLLEKIIETQRREHQCGASDSYSFCYNENEVEVLIYYKIIKTLTINKLLLILYEVKSEFDYLSWWKTEWNFEIAKLKKEIINLKKGVKTNGNN